MIDFSNLWKFIQKMFANFWTFQKQVLININRLKWNLFFVKVHMQTNHNQTHCDGLLKIYCNKHTLIESYKYFMIVYFMFVMECYEHSKSNVLHLRLSLKWNLLVFCSTVDTKKIFYHVPYFFNMPTVNIRDIYFYFADQPTQTFLKIWPMGQVIRKLDR